MRENFPLLLTCATYREGKQPLAAAYMRESVPIVLVNQPPHTGAALLWLAVAPRRLLMLFQFLGESDRGEEAQRAPDEVVVEPLSSLNQP